MGAGAPASRQVTQVWTEANAMGHLNIPQPRHRHPIRRLSKAPCSAGTSTGTHRAPRWRAILIRWRPLVIATWWCGNSHRRHAGRWRSGCRERGHLQFRALRTLERRELRGTEALQLRRRPHVNRYREASTGHRAVHKSLKIDGDHSGGAAWVRSVPNGLTPGAGGAEGKYPAIGIGRGMNVRAVDPTSEHRRPCAWRFWGA